MTSLRCVDVNVLVYAHRSELTRHDEARRWLDAARRGREPLGISSTVLAGFLRIATHPRVFRDPTPPGAALEFTSALRASPACVPVEPGDRHWEIFTDLHRTLGLRGNEVPDAYLAALAIEHGATWITADRGFARFPGLRSEQPW